MRFDWKDNLGKSHQRSFSQLPINPNKALKESVKITLSDINEVNKTAILQIENTAFVQNFWIFSSKQNIRFENNFIDLLPGKHAIQINFDHVPEVSEFDFLFQ